MQAASPELAVAVPRVPAGSPSWAHDGADWPNRQFSRFVRADGLRWHVQVAGQGPVLLLLHGTGAATHSWRDIFLPLAEHFTVIAPDLPGHGFTEQPESGKMSLPGMAHGIAALLAQLGLKPEFGAGHSAGAAILVQMCLDGQIAPAKIISLNGALVPFGDRAHVLFAPVARLIARNPLMPLIFSWRAADPAVVNRLLDGTGSTIDARGRKFYARLARRSGHTGAALLMMGNWDLAGLFAALPKLAPKLVLVVGENDRSIPPTDAARIQAQLPAARIIRQPKLGHLAHEERPSETVELIKANCA
jgi:magnesium chelatase accessory protein